jgi:hypothetical protein
LSGCSHFALVALGSGVFAWGCTYEPATVPPWLMVDTDAAGRPGDAGAPDQVVAVDRDPANPAADAAPTVPDAAPDRPEPDRPPASDRAVDAGPNPTSTEDPPCLERTRVARAIDGVSLDYGPPPRDPPQTDPLEISAGRLHDHDHDVTAWLKFPLTEVPAGARLRRLRLLFTATINPPTLVPDIALVYSPFDGWSKTSTEPTDLPRTIFVGGGSGPLIRGRQTAEVDLTVYGPRWAADLADGFLSLGLAPADDRDGPFRYATVQSAVPGNSDDPTIELVICE